MKRLSLIFCAVLLVLGFQAMPRYAHAANKSVFLITCGEVDPTHARPVDPAKPEGEKECGFLDVIAEIKLLINTFLMLSIPIATIVIAYSGVQILFAQGNVSKITDARKRIQNIVIGIIIILAAWLIVYTIVSVLLKPEFYTPFLGNK